MQRILNNLLSTENNDYFYNTTLLLRCCIGEMPDCCNWLNRKYVLNKSLFVR